MRLPRRLIILAAVIVLGGAGLTTWAVVSSKTNGCNVAAQIPPLPPQLRAMGDFDQAYQAADLRTIQDAASRAASALYPDLATAITTDPVSVHAVQNNQLNALVIPLEVDPAANGSPQKVAGLVAFLVDCSGRAWYSGTEDVSRERQGSLPVAFPSVSEATAQQQLDINNPELVYTSSPFMPQWRNPSTARSIAAFP